MTDSDSDSDSTTYDSDDEPIQEKIVHPEYDPEGCFYFVCKSCCQEIDNHQFFASVGAFFILSTKLIGNWKCQCSPVDYGLQPLCVYYNYNLTKARVYTFKGFSKKFPDYTIIDWRKSPSYIFRVGVEQ